MKPLELINKAIMKQVKTLQFFRKIKLHTKLAPETVR